MSIAWRANISIPIRWRSWWLAMPKILTKNFPPSAKSPPSTFPFQRKSRRNKPANCNLLPRNKKGTLNACLSYLKFAARFLVRYSSSRAVFFKSLLQAGSNRHGIAALNVAALHHVHQFAVAQQANRRRGRWIACEVVARCVGSFAVLAGKNGNHAVWLNAALDSRTHAGTHSSRHATTD